jgi:hypothetical protein
LVTLRAPRINGDITSSHWRHDHHAETLMARKLRSAIELVSDIGALGFDLQHHSDSDIAKAVQVLREVNGPMFTWLVKVLGEPERKGER